MTDLDLCKRFGVLERQAQEVPVQEGHIVCASRVLCRAAITDVESMMSADLVYSGLRLHVLAVQIADITSPRCILAIVDQRHTGRQIHAAAYIHPPRDPEGTRRCAMKAMEVRLPGSYALPVCLHVLLKAAMHHCMASSAHACRR